MEKLKINSANPPNKEKQKQIYKEISLLIQKLYYS